MFVWVSFVGGEGGREMGRWGNRVGWGWEGDQN